MEHQTCGCLPCEYLRTDPEPTWANYLQWREDNAEVYNWSRVALKVWHRFENEDLGMTKEQVLTRFLEEAPREHEVTPWGRTYIRRLRGGEPERAAALDSFAVEISPEPAKVKGALKMNANGYIHRTEYWDRIEYTWRPKVAGGIQGGSKPGGMWSLWMSAQTANKVRRAADYVTRPGAECRFLTLSYRYPVCHQRTKRDFDRWLKRYKRAHSGSVEFVWVAELTKNELLHFHVLIRGAVRSMDWFRRSWSEVTGQELEPDCKSVDPEDSGSIAGYLTKYVTKSVEGVNVIYGRRWGASRSVTAGVKPMASDMQEANWSCLHDLRKGLYKRDPTGVEFTAWGMFRKTAPPA